MNSTPENPLGHFQSCPGCSAGVIHGSLGPTMNPDPQMAEGTNPLPPPDCHHLNAAEGWLGLGDWASANLELDKITSELCTHPAVLRVRGQVYAAAEQWEAAAAISRVLSVMDPASPPL